MMITTPLDSAILDSKEHYVLYHKLVHFALHQLIEGIEKQQLCNEQEMKMFTQYSDLLLYSIEAMRVKYMYDDEENMKVDLTNSGFPNYLEFRYLYNDLALRNEYLHKLTDIQLLKTEFLDTLLRKKQPIKRNRLFQAASLVYYSSVKQEYIFNKFVQGKILQANNTKYGEYVVSWSFYDVSLNRPFVCFMYFNYDGKKIEKYKETIYETLLVVADRKMTLDSMAYAIDKKLPDVHPKYIKRIDLGPLHTIFAKDENVLTHSILQSIANKEISPQEYAISLTIDEVFSGVEFKEGSFFNKQTLQKWSSPLSKQYIFAPHRLIQLFYNKVPHELNHLTMPPIQVNELNN